MRRAMILFLACVPLLFGLFSTAVAWEKKVVLSELFTATW
jgi:hypothetical protein